MICSEFFALLDNYESITDEQRAEMEKHTAECETCRKELEFFKSVMCNLASIPTPEAPKTLIDKVNAKLDAEKPVVVGFKWNFRVLSTVAACLAIGLAVGINNGYIKDIITNNSTEGVISQTVAGTPEVGGEAPVEASVAPRSGEAEKPVSESETPANPTVREKTKVVVAKSTEKPVVTATKAPVRTEAPKVDKPQIVAAHTEAPAPTPDNAQDVEAYEIKSDGPQIAYGRYNVEVARRTPGEFSDYLHVESDDMGAVVSTMSEMGVRNSGGYYMTSRQNFYALMDTLNDKGVGYECDLQYNSGENISFRLTYN